MLGISVYGRLEPGALVLWEGKSTSCRWGIIVAVRGEQVDALWGEWPAGSNELAVEQAFTKIRALSKQVQVII